MFGSNHVIHKSSRVRTSALRAVNNECEDHRKRTYFYINSLIMSSNIQLYHPNDFPTIGSFSKNDEKNRLIVFDTI